MRKYWHKYDSKFHTQKSIGTMILICILKQVIKRNDMKLYLRSSRDDNRINECVLGTWNNSEVEVNDKNKKANKQANKTQQETKQNETKREHDNINSGSMVKPKGLTLSSTFLLNV